MPFPDNRYSFIRAKLTGLFSFLFCSGSQKIGADHWKGRSECGTGRTKKPKKPPYYLSYSAYGEHTKKQAKKSKNETHHHSPKKKRKEKEKGKGNAVKDLLFWGGGVKGKTEK